MELNLQNDCALNRFDTAFPALARLPAEYNPDLAQSSNTPTLRHSEPDSRTACPTKPMVYVANRWKLASQARRAPQAERCEVGRTTTRTRTKRRVSAVLWATFIALVSLTHAEDQKLAAVRIGYQKYGTLNVLKAEGSFQKSLAGRGIAVTWILFPAGPQLLEALNAGSIDFGDTGEAPPIFAQAAGVNLVYFGNQPPFPKGEGLLVKKDSPIQKVSDLKGKRIALNKGSNVHFFLVKLLEKYGLKIDDITPAYLTPADAWAALEGGSVDAWAVWDPYLTAAVDRSGARILQDAEGVAANREFFLADRRFAQAHSDILLAVRDAVNRSGTWVTTKPEEVVRYLAPQLGMSEAVINKVVRATPWGFQPITDQVVSDQQTIGDTFFGLKLIPKTIQVADAVVRIPD